MTTRTLDTFTVSPVRQDRTPRAPGSPVVGLIAFAVVFSAFSWAAGAKTQPALCAADGVRANLIAAQTERDAALAAAPYVSAKVGTLAGSPAQVRADQALASFRAADAAYAAACSAN